MRIMIILLFLTKFGFGQESNDSFRLNFILEIVNVLAADSMFGREVGTSSEQKSLNFISSKFKEASNKKLKVQSFDFTLNGQQISSKNGYYFINNRKKETILIGAHYDHIGMGGPLSLSMTSDEIHNGADDNASGVALLLALSEQLIHQKSSKYNYLIVFYSAHEVGLYGSQAFYIFLKKKERKFKNFKFVLNFDMVGRFNSTLKKLKCMSSHAMVASLEKVRFEGLILNITEEEKLKKLDTKAFVENGIACVNFTTGLHDDYHATSDDSKYINFEGILLIEKFIFEFLKSLE